LKPWGKSSELRKLLRPTGQLMGGTLAGQIISVLSGFVLTRLYTPEDFALLEWFALVVSLGMTAATLRLEQALLLPQSDDIARGLLRSGIWSSAWFSLALVVGGGLLVGWWGETLGLQRMEAWAFALLAGAVTFISAQGKMWEYWVLRKDSPRTIAISNAIGPWFSEGVKWSTAGVGAQVGGLIWGVSLGAWVKTAYLRRTAGKDALHWWRMSISSVQHACRGYRDYPTWILLGSLTNRTAQWLHVVVAAATLDPWMVGFVALSRRMVLQPLTIVSQAFAPVFYRHLSQISNPHAIRSAFWRASAGLGALALLVLFCVAWVPEGAVGWLFGADWEPALEVTQILAPWFVANFVTAGLGGVMHKLRRSKAIFGMDVLHLGFVLVGWGAGHYWGSGADSLDALRGMVVAKVLYYALQWTQMAWSVSRAEKYAE
jgi:O-antigen/teichoic acid export membrane protein